MKVHAYEKAMLIVGAGILVACGAALIYASVAMNLHLPGNAGFIEPRRVYQTAPFNRPGVREVAPGRYEAAIVAQTWAFIPREIRVPAGAEVTFNVTSIDILHGFNIEGTRLNLMLIPGQVSRNSYTFDRPGEYLIICHEYCGLGHHTMAGKVIVEPARAAIAAPAASATDGAR
jgi:cytochrome c oxidase subunit 2